MSKSHLSKKADEISAAGRQAAVRRDWAQVSRCARDLKRMLPREAEGHYLLGLAQKGRGRIEDAAAAFSRALDLDDRRYDAAVELAFLLVLLNRHGEARILLDKYRPGLGNSPRYLDLAGQTYSRMSLHQEAWDAYQLADRLQPDVDKIQANLASCAVYLGKTDVAKNIYHKLLAKHPKHQRNHYELAQLQRASNDEHVRQMIALLDGADPDPAKNIYLYYAIGKELEDLERWDESFEYYLRAGNAVKSVSDYDVSEDVAVMDKIRNVCSAAWLADAPSAEGTTRTPIFIVGLPRTGTTLTDRILASHSRVESAGETQLLQMVLRRLGGAEQSRQITPAAIEAAATAEPRLIAGQYYEAISYRLGEAPLFIDKLPENVLFLGFVAKAWPDAKIVHLRRNPLDACFAMFKQSYFRFAYSLDDLAEYYLAYDRLSRHWREVLGNRMIELEYEQLVTDQDNQTRILLDRLGLAFEEACLRLDSVAAPIATASSAQVREKVHTRSVGKWTRYRKQLAGLKQRLEAGGVVTE
ncbi:MAG TPA: sulfotransferase [Woeseiaceae bacterium]